MRVGLLVLFVKAESLLLGSLVLNLEIICLRDCFQPGSFVFLSRASSPRRDAIKGLEKPTSTQC